MNDTATGALIRSLVDLLARLDSLELTERDRTTIRRACSAALVQSEDDLVSQYGTRNAGKPFSKADLEDFKRELEAVPPPTNWGEERAVLEMLSQRLGRSEKSIKKKAIELGYGVRVDYWINQDPA